jgi:radical SAM-linked protein
MACDKVRIRFQKTGDLRLVSHHDLMRCFERMLRRSGLPFRSSKGFHPKPRLSFALSLPLGVISSAEIVDLELDEILPTVEILQRLARQAPPGLILDSIERINPKAPTQVRALCYRVPIPERYRDGLPKRIAEILAAATCPVERIRPESRTVDLRPFIRTLRLSDAALEIELWVTPQGTARPPEVLGLLGLDEITAQGSVVERTRLELSEEPSAQLPSSDSQALASAESSRLTNALLSHPTNR